MGGNRFAQLAQEILRQKQLMDKLEAENRELRQQIADLRSGRGIFVDICGIRFALRDDSSLVQTTSASSVPAKTSTVTSTATTTPLPVVSPLNEQTVDAQMAEIAEITAQMQEQDTKEQASPANTDESKTSASGESPFLEEIMIDEFASALTSPNAVWQDPTEKKPAKRLQKAQEPINEKQKEALRRELMGSYLLE